MRIEICYALEEQQFLQCLEVSEGSTVQEVITASGVCDLFPNLTINAVGIFSKKVTLDQIVKEGDRVEIYRPLKLSPNQARLLRAKKLKKLRQPTT